MSIRDQEVIEACTRVWVGAMQKDALSRENLLDAASDLGNIFSRGWRTQKHGVKQLHSDKMGAWHPSAFGHGGLASTISPSFQPHNS